jgi:hypothetical protein
MEPVHQQKDDKNKTADAKLGKWVSPFVQNYLNKQKKEKDEEFKGYKDDRESTKKQQELINNINPNDKKAANGEEKEDGLKGHEDNRESTIKQRELIDHINPPEKETEQEEKKDKQKKETSSEVAKNNKKEKATAPIEDYIDKASKKIAAKKGKPEEKKETKKKEGEEVFNEDIPAANENANAIEEDASQASTVDAPTADTMLPASELSSSDIAVPEVEIEPPEVTETSTVADAYLSAPLSEQIPQMGSVGASFNKAFSADRKAIADKNKVKASLDSSTVEPPPPPPEANKGEMPELKNWEPSEKPEKKEGKREQPKVDTSGEANPKQVDQQNAEEQTTALKQQEAVAGDISNLPGQEQIKGVNLNMEETLEIPKAAIVPQAKKTAEMEAYMAMPLSSFRAKTDQAASDEWASKVDEAKDKIHENIRKRDEEQTKAIADTQTQASKLETQAQLTQEQEIAKSRGAIQGEKEKGMAESRAQLEEYQTKTSEARDKQIGAIEDRIKKDEQTANRKLDEADQKIAQEKKKAEEKKKKEKEEAEKKKKKRSFWQKIGDFFSNLFKKLKEVLKKIVDAVTKLVKSILAAAQKLVNKIIDLAVKFIAKAIKVFAAIAKKFLAVALFAFPRIRDQVLEAIDVIVETTVQAIYQAAEFLKEQVQALVNKAMALIDFASRFFEAMIDGGFAMLQAIITGNFKDIPKIAFMTACNALGLPGEEFWGILMKAKNEIWNIIKNPIGFLKNLIKAGKTGFTNFMKNFLIHLQRGLMGWLFGQMDATGIVLPRKFDLPNIFNFIRNLLGFTLPYIEKRIMHHVGEENIEKGRKVIGIFRMVFQEGPAGLWKMFKAGIGNIKQMLLGKVQEFIVVQIIQKAITKLISMLIPGGGFLQAIWGAYQTLMFFIENIQKIAMLVNGIMDSLGRITRGKIAEAAVLIENVMVNSLPLIFRFLAKLIGISGIGKRVAKIVQKLRTPVNKAIDLTVGKAVKGVKSGFGKAKAGVSKGWNKMKSSGKKGFNAARKGGIKAGFSSVKEDARDAKESAKLSFQEKKEQAKAKYQDMKQGAKDKVAGVKDSVMGAKEKAKEKWQAAKTEVKSGFKGARTKIKNKVSAKWQNAKNKVKASIAEKAAWLKSKLFGAPEEEQDTDDENKPGTSLTEAQKEKRRVSNKLPKPHRGLRISGKAETPELEMAWGLALADLNTLLVSVEEGGATDREFEEQLFDLRVAHDFDYLSGRIKNGTWSIRWNFTPSGTGQGSIKTQKKKRKDEEDELVGVTLHPAIRVEDRDVDKSTDIKALQKALNSLNELAQTMEENPLSDDSFQEKIEELSKTNPGLSLRGEVRTSSWKLKWAFNPDGVMEGDIDRFASLRHLSQMGSVFGARTINRKAVARPSSNRIYQMVAQTSAAGIAPDTSTKGFIPDPVRQKAVAAKSALGQLPFGGQHSLSEKPKGSSKKTVQRTAFKYQTSTIPKKASSLGGFKANSPLNIAPNKDQQEPFKIE